MRSERQLNEAQFAGQLGKCLLVQLDELQIIEDNRRRLG
jgi:hypothetical protein